MGTLASLLGLTGLIALFGGLLGSILWVDGKPRGEIRSKSKRVTLGIVGVLLIGCGVWSNYQADLASRQPDPAQERILTTLQQEAQRLRGQVRELTVKTMAQEQLISQLLEDHRVIAARSSFSALGQPDIGCDRALRRSTRGWEAESGSPCTRFLRSMWTIDVLVPLSALESKLLQELQLTGFRVTMADPRARHGGAAVDGLGIVFPDDAPRSLVCRVRRAFVDIVKHELVAATTTSVWWRSGNPRGSTHAIQIGVPFNDHFAAGYPRMTPDLWENLCGGAYDGLSFSDYFQSLSARYIPKEATETEGDGQ